MKVTLISTPIGNLDDISSRAIDAFKNSDLILCEDTRVTRSLISKLDIGECKNSEFISFNDHSADKIPFIIEKIKNSRFPVLVSDAGSPVISDPAYPLLKACLEEEIEIDTCPGVSSVTVALELSGLPSTPYSFHGFLPRSKGDVLKALKSHESLGHTHVYFESPHRIISTLEIIKTHLPQSEIAICRELTKKFQSVYRSKSQELNLEEIQIKGEFVLCLYHPNALMSSSNASSSELQGLANKYLNKSSTKNLSKLLSLILDRNAKEIYDELIKAR